jgi:hypothetical protein
MAVSSILTLHLLELRRTYGPIGGRERTIYTSDWYYRVTRVILCRTAAPGSTGARAPFTS